jgi:hypothetical protein
MVLNDSDIIRTLENEDKAFSFLMQTPVYRSFPQQCKLTTEAADVLREVLVNGRVNRDLNNKGIKLCYEQGWLHSEPLDYQGFKIVCVLPTQLHAK